MGGREGQGGRPTSKRVMHFSVFFSKSSFLEQRSLSHAREQSATVFTSSSSSSLQGRRVPDQSSRYEIKNRDE